MKLSSIIKNILIFMLLLFVFTQALHRQILYYFSVLRSDSSVFFNTIVIISIFSLLLYLINHFLLHNSKKQNTVFLFILSTLIIIISTINIFIFDNELTSDYYNYYNFSKDIANGSLIFDFSNIHQKRMLFFLIPLFKIFPAEPITYKIFNIGVHITTTLGFYFLFKKTDPYSNIPKYAVVLYGLYPTVFSNMLLPSHSLYANFILMLIFNTLYYLFLYLKELSLIKKGLLVVLIILLLIILEITRSTGVLFSLSILAGSLIFWVITKKINILQFSIIIILSIFTIGGSKIINSQYSKAKQELSQNKRISSSDMPNMLFSYNNLDGGGSYGNGFENRFFLFPYTYKEEGYKLPVSKLLSQMNSFPGESLELLGQKGREFLSFSLYSIRSSSESYITNSQIEKLSLSLNIVKTPIIILIIIGLLKLILKKKLKLFECVFISYFFTLFAFILVSEVKGAYGFLVYPVLFYMAAIGINEISKFRVKKINTRKINDTLKAASMVSVNLLAITIIIVLSLRLLYLSYPYKTINLNNEPVSIEKGQIKKSNIPFRDAYHLEIMSNLDSTCVFNISNTNLEKNKKRISFFLTSRDNAKITIIQGRDTLINNALMNKKHINNYIINEPVFSDYFMVDINADNITVIAENNSSIELLYLTSIK